MEKGGPCNVTFSRIGVLSGRIFRESIPLEIPILYYGRVPGKEHLNRVTTAFCYCMLYNVRY